MAEALADRGVYADDLLAEGGANILDAATEELAHKLLAARARRERARGGFGA